MTGTADEHGWTQLPNRSIRQPWVDPFVWLYELFMFYKTTLGG